jgi:hypothetical protein
LTRTTHRQLTCIAIVVLLIPAGLACRFAPLGLPQVFVKYGGSFLWAAAVYWLIATLLPRVQPLHLGVIAAVVATCVEFFKRVQTPGLNAFRDTFAGKVLLGRYFSYTDIAVYFVAIVCAAWIDGRIVASRRHRMHQEIE